MPDDRRSGAGKQIYGSSSALRFSSMNHSSNTADIQDKRRGKDSFEQDIKNPSASEQEIEFEDRSSQLRATLNSLALQNVIIINKKQEKEKNDRRKAKNMKRDSDNED